MSPENLGENVYLSGNYYFEYLGNGWERFEKDVFEMAYILVCIVSVSNTNLTLPTTHYV